jgi:hypothetical protein
MKKKEKYFVVADTYETGKGEMALEGDNIVYCGGCKKKFYSAFGTKKEKWERERGGKTGRRFWQCDSCQSWNTTITLDIGTYAGMEKYERLPEETNFIYFPETKIYMVGRDIQKLDLDKMGDYWLMELYFVSGRKIEFVCSDTKEGRNKIRKKYELLDRGKWEELDSGIDSERYCSVNLAYLEQIELSLISDCKNKDLK